MSEKRRDQIPGVRLDHRGSRIFEVAGQKNVELVLVAKINDENVWKEVEKKFLDGFSVYTSEDFKGEMLSAMNLEVADLETKVRLLEADLGKKEQEIALLRTQLDDAQRPLRELGRRLGAR